MHSERLSELVLFCSCVCRAVIRGFLSIGGAVVSLIDSLFPVCCISSILSCLLSVSFLLSSEDPEGQMSTEEEEARKIAEMGKPVLGEHSRLEVVIEESYEFKVTVENIESSQCIFDFIFKESYEFSLRFQI